MIRLLPNAAGVAFSRAKSRFNVVSAGRRSGKTERAKRRIVMRALIGSPHAVPRFGAFAPTALQAKAVFWQDLKAMTRPFWHSEPSESELTIYVDNYFGTVSELCVRGLDRPQRIEGVPWNWMHIDEADDVRPGFWDEHLRPCLSDRKGGADFTGVPEGIGFLYDLSLLPGTDPEWAFFTWPSREVLPLEEIESARRTMDARTFRQEYEASFENASGRVYYAFDRQHNVREAPAGILAGSLGVGMDFNVSPMSAVILADTPEATWIIDEIVIGGRSNTNEMVAEIRARYGDRVKDAYPDPTGRHGSTNAPVGRSDHDILRQSGLRVLCRGTSNVRDGINAVNSRLCSAAGERRLFVDPKCKTLIQALERHAYKEGTSQPDRDDDWNHIADALRYGVEYLHPIRKREEWAQ